MQDVADIFRLELLKNFFFLNLLFRLQVPENCCSDDGKKWKDLFKGVRPGHVCCNAPCNEMESNHCPLPDHCNKIEGRSLGDGGVAVEASTRSVGINPKYLDHSYSTGKHYSNIYATADQLKHSNYAVSIPNVF